MIFQGGVSLSDNEYWWEAGRQWGDEVTVCWILIFREQQTVCNLSDFLFKNLPCPDQRNLLGF